MSTTRREEFVTSSATTVNGESMSLTPDRDPGTPVWQVAELFPRQGEWSEDDYLRLETNRLIELSDGSPEFLAMPTEWHQLLALYLYRRLVE